MSMQRPQIVLKEHLDYLDRLRKSDKTNMFGAAEYLAKEFSLATKDAKLIWIYWAETFGKELR